jgi:hypothetical protein
MLSEDARGERSRELLAVVEELFERLPCLLVGQAELLRRVEGRL